MNYDEEINYRNRILARIRDGKKITSEDRLWLVTHRIINRVLGYPYINTDVIHLQQNVNYLIRVNVEKLTYPNRIIPVITVPGGKGRIIANSALVDHNGNISTKEAVKMLGVMVDSNHNEAEFTYQSNLGLLGISYECDYFDSRQHIMLRKNSCVGDSNFAMLREVLADNKMRYRCKVPTNKNFDSFVFSIEWNKEAKK